MPLTSDQLNQQAARLLATFFQEAVPPYRPPLFRLIECLLSPDGLLELPPGMWRLDFNRYQEWTDLAASNPEGLLAEVLEFLNQSSDPSLPTSKSLPALKQWAARLVEGVQSQLPNAFPQEAINE